MAITLWTDTFCTVAEADVSIALFDNNIWLDKTTAQKESYLKAVTKLIDLQVFRGEVAVDGQVLQFPRSFDSVTEGADRIYYPEDFYSTATQTKRLAQACSAQIKKMLSPVQVDDIKGGAYDDRYTLCDEAKEYIKIYMFPVSVLDTSESGWDFLNIGRWYNGYAARRNNIF